MQESVLRPLYSIFMKLHNLCQFICQYNCRYLSVNLFRRGSANKEDEEAEVDIIIVIFYVMLN